MILAHIGYGHIIARRGESWIEIFLKNPHVLGKKKRCGSIIICLNTFKLSSGMRCSPMKFINYLSYWGNYLFKISHFYLYKSD